MLHHAERKTVFGLMEMAIRIGEAGQPDLAEVHETGTETISGLATLAEHADWRIRYAAAVAMGESQSDVWLPVLESMLMREDGRSLYSQPRVHFRNSYDDTRMAEQLVPIEVVFDQSYPDDLKDDWRCRGRVKQACLFAIAAIGQLTPSLNRTLQDYLMKPDEDNAVGAAAAMALGQAGNRDCLTSLEKALEKDEWCLQTEARKAIRLIQQRAEA